MKIRNPVAYCSIEQRSIYFSFEIHAILTTFYEINEQERMEKKVKMHAFIQELGKHVLREMRASAMGCRLVKKNIFRDSERIVSN